MREPIRWPNSGPSESAFACNETVEECAFGSQHGAMSDQLTRSLDLMRKAQSGDGDALNRLMGRYYGRVRPIVRARIGPHLRRRIDSGDILQQVFVTAFRTYDRFEVTDEASLIGWLARIAERQIHDELDRQAAQKREAGREVALQAGSASAPSTIDLPDPAGRPEESAEQREQARIVEEELAELPELYRELILLRDYQGASWEHVAKETLRPSAAAARMMHGQARVELGKRVKARGLG